MIPDNILNKIPIVLNVKYKKQVTERERRSYEKKVIPVFTDLGFEIVATSLIGLSVSAFKYVIEQTFDTKIEFTYLQDPNSTLKEKKIPSLVFQSAPKIPEKLNPYISSVHLSPTIKPLNQV